MDKYFAFLSHDHEDREFVKRLHRDLERYRIPKQIRIKTGIDNLHPIFLDRDELPATHQLTKAIEDALSESKFLVLVVSDHSMQSEWVRSEVEHFLEDHEPSKLIVAIAPGHDPAKLPDYLPQDQKKFEPLAADFNANGDECRGATLKIVASVLGISLGDLVKRDQLARQIRNGLLAATSVAGLFLIAALTQSVLTSIEEARLKKIQELKSFATNAQRATQSGLQLTALTELNTAYAQLTEGNEGIFAEVSSLKDAAYRTLLSYRFERKLAKLEGLVEFFDVANSGEVMVYALFGQSSKVFFRNFDGNSKVLSINFEGERMLCFAFVDEDKKIIVSSSNLLERRFVKRILDAQTFEVLLESDPSVNFSVAIAGLTGHGCDSSADGTKLYWAETVDGKQIGWILDGSSLKKLSKVEHGTDRFGPVSFSNDNSKIIAGSEYVVTIWNTLTGELVTELNSPVDPPGVYGHFSPDGTKAISSSGNGSLWMWDQETNTTTEKRDFTDSKANFAMSDNGQYLLASTRRFLTLFQLFGLDFRPKSEFNSDGFRLDPPDVTPDGVHALAILDRQGEATVSLMELNSGGISLELKGFEGSPHHARFSQTGDEYYVVTHDTDENISRITKWATSPRSLIELPIPGNARMLATRGNKVLMETGSELVVWNFESQRELSRVKNPGGRILEANFSLDANKYVALTWDNYVRWQDLKSNDGRSERLSDDNWKWGLSVDQKANRVAIFNSRGDLHFRDLADFSRTGEEFQFGEFIREAYWDQKGSEIITTGDNFHHKRSISNLVLTGRRDHDHAFLKDVRLEHDLTISVDSSHVYLRRMSTGELVEKLEGSPNNFGSVAIDDSGKWLMTTNAKERSLIVWNLESKQEVGRIEEFFARTNVHGDSSGPEKFLFVGPEYGWIFSYAGKVYQVFIPTNTKVLATRIRKLYQELDKPD